MLANSKVRTAVGLIAGLTVVTLAYGLFQYLSVSYVIARAKNSLKEGYPAVAADWVEESRRAVLRHPDGCQVMVDSYFSARDAKRLEWAAEACLELGRDVAEMHLGLAIAREMMGRDQDALEILDSAKKKFQKSPGVPLRMAQILKRNNQFDAAAEYYLEAVSRASDNQSIALEALQFFNKAGMGDRSRLIATKLKGIETENPEVKLIIARGLKLGGDPESAEALGRDAIGLMATNKEMREKLENAYNDVLRPEVEASRGVAGENAELRKPDKKRKR